MSRFLFLLIALGALATSSVAAPIEVTALHPILGDLAREVGGDQVVVRDLLAKGSDPHGFTPTATDLASLKQSKVVLASGKGLESYLPKVRAATQGRVVEVGRRIPSITVSAESPLFLCCPKHAQGAIDPHWWHSPKNMGRAARVVADAFAEADPSGKADYRRRAQNVAKRMSALDKFTQKQVAAIPMRDRKLVTAHLAFGYFCKDYGFKAIGLQGLTPQQKPTAKDLAEAVATVKKEKIRVAFPEHLANPQMLQSLARETGLKFGRPLLADNLSAEVSTYEAMMRHNVDVIVSGYQGVK